MGINIHQHMACSHMAMEIVCNAMSKNFLLMFANSWDFFYDKSSKTLRSLPPYQNINFQYLGIETKEIHKKDVCRESIKNYIDKYHVLTMSIDSYYCPWHKGYMKIHTGHCCAIIDYNSDGIICIDPYLMGTSQILLPERVLKYGNYDYYKEQKNYKEIDVSILIKDIIDKEIEKQKMFSMLKNFKTDISNVIDSSQLFDFPQDVYLCEITRTLKFISDGRMQLGYLLEWLNQTNPKKSEQIIIIHKLLYNSGEIWQYINNLLIKLFFIPSQLFSIKNKIVIYLSQIIEIETRIFSIMKEYCRCIK